MGIDHLILLTFNEALSRQDGESFIKNHLVENLRMVHLVAGPEFSLGNDRLSKPEQLQDVGARTGFTFEIVPSFRLGKQAVSSTLIRYKLQVGDVEAANSMLGYEYKLWGRVTTGNQIGKAIGFPTATWNWIYRIKPSLATGFMWWPSVGKGAAFRACVISADALLSAGAILVLKYISLISTMIFMMNILLFVS